MIQQYLEKDFIIDRLITYLKRELNLEYFRYKISDINGNTADVIIKNDSKIFKSDIEGKEYIKFNVEELIDKRMFDNYDEIILLDLNFEENILTLDFLGDSLKYNYLSYSKEIIDKLAIFINYIINRNND